MIEPSRLRSKRFAFSHSKDELGSLNGDLSQEPPIDYQALFMNQQDLQGRPLANSWHDERQMLDFLSREREELKDSHAFLDFDFTDPVTPAAQDSSFEGAEYLEMPASVKQHATSLKKFARLIHGDLLHCVVCSSKFDENGNLPRVLFCGDCLCERCLK